MITAALIVAVLTVGWLLFATGFYVYLTVCAFVEGR